MLWEGALLCTALQISYCFVGYHFYPAVAFGDHKFGNFLPGLKIEWQNRLYRRRNDRISRLDADNSLANSTKPNDSFCINLGLLLNRYKSTHIDP